MSASGNMKLAAKDDCKFCNEICSFFEVRTFQNASTFRFTRCSSVVWYFPYQLHKASNRFHHTFWISKYSRKRKTRKRFDLILSNLLNLFVFFAVHTVFANVASKYDLMNDAMSVGIHRLWKDYFIKKAKPTSNSKIIDVAGGTGDIAFRLLRHMQTSPGGSGDITILDINQAMLDVGMHRAQQDNTLDLNKLKWVCANAEALPFENDQFDLYTIAFGIRNCTHVDKVILLCHLKT